MPFFNLIDSSFSSHEFHRELNLFLNIPLPLSSILFPFIPDLFITVFRRINGSIKYIRSSLTSNL